MQEEPKTLDLLYLLCYYTQTLTHKGIDMKPTPQQIRSWINRQRTLPNPSQQYIEWLRKQFRITCTAQVIKDESRDKLRNS